MKHSPYKNIALLIITFSLVLFTSCDRGKNNPGYIYFPDMTYSRAYESFSPNPVFEGGHTMITPVEGTVPRDIIPYYLTNSVEDRVLAGKIYENPFQANETSLTRGHEMFVRFCVQCHGEKGDGKGILYTSGRYPFPPRSLLTDLVQEVPNGEIFHVITVGFGVMGAHGSQINPDDRWHIANYVQNVLSSDTIQ